MTILEALHWGEKTIKHTLDQKKEQHHNAKLDAQLLLAKAVGMQKSHLIGHLSDTVSDTAFQRFEEMVMRRSQHEPISYILEEGWFYGRPFTVNPFVLIPRPETEQLIDIAKQHITPSTEIIDLGTGSGCIAITIACETHRPVLAIDNDANALRIAQTNVSALAQHEAITIQKGDLLTPYFEKVRKSHKHLLIMANLPYVPRTEAVHMDPDVLQYEPLHAIFSGEDGLDGYKALFQQLHEQQHTLPKKTTVICEIDPSQKTALPAYIQTIFEHMECKIEYDIHKRPRFAIITITQ